ncbi:MAG: hypothetical protein ABI534_02455 [Chloroflexota bacterium]
MTARLVRLLVVALLLAAVAPLGLAPAPAFAAEYTMETVARYVVEPDARHALVSVEVTFTNTTPDPAGQFSLFPAVELAIHDTATDVAATDDKGDLSVAAATRDEVNVATVTLREPLRFEEAATFTLTYTLPDGPTAQLRIRPSIVVLPIWSFGTSGTVSVELPADYTVRADGDPLTARRAGEASILESGAIGDPTKWLALISADRETSYETLEGTAELASGSLAIEVRAFADDVAWGEAARDLLVRALPLLERWIGIGDTPAGPIVVIESPPNSAAEAPPSIEPEIRVGFDEPPFTLLHQAAHLWINDSLLADRWSREGLASYMAGTVAAELEVAEPYDPIKRRDEQAASAVPLVIWQDTALDGYGYPASWAFFRELKGEVGTAPITEALSRIASGRGGYDERLTTAEGVDPEAAGTRQLLDQLELTSGADLAPRFVAAVLGTSAQPEIDARAAARTAYAALEAQAGEWGTSAPVRAAMEDWRFGEAGDEIAAASSWLVDRDALLADIDAAGLSVPTRLRDRYEQSGGGTEAQDELEAERTVVEAYRSGVDAASAERSLLARIGLAGGTAPDESLATANDLFGEGDLRGASDAITAARERLDSADTAGLLRLLSAVAAIALIVGVVIVLLRRRPNGREPA